MKKNNKNCEQVTPSHLLTKTLAFLFSVTFLFTTAITAQVPVCTGTSDTTFSFTGGPQTFTVPAGVSQIDITAIGAGGGSARNGTYNVETPGGKGAVINGTFNVSPRQVLTVIVGGEGERGAGGGGSFVFNGTADALANLWVAAGGGGATNDTSSSNTVIHASTDTTAKNGNGGVKAGIAGVGANGGKGGDGGGGGGGIITDGGDGDECGLGSGGGSIISGAAGGDGSCIGSGGYGGGGEGRPGIGGGGGGGYNGGGSSDDGASNNSGGGGSSFVAASGIPGPTALADVPEDGSVIICYSVSPIPALSEWGLFLFGLVVFTVFAVGIYNLRFVWSKQ